MPWLIKSDENEAEGTKNLDEHLLFVHVPRCGGTSLTQHFGVPEKCMEGRNWWRKIGMRYFFHTYHKLESANFPIFTPESFLALCIFAMSILVLRAGGHEAMGYSLLGISIFAFVGPAFLFTAPFIGRNDWVRRPYLRLVHEVLCRFMESIPWISGTNKTGYMMHLTARKLLAYGYVSPEEMDNVCSMAIVRNPYSRMVSIYMYNRYGSGESFSHFVKSWYKIMKAYRESNETEEYYTPCHCLPQFEFTHFEGRQLVQSVIKQEELKWLKHKCDVPTAIAQDSSISDLPDLVRDALLGMPHVNARKKDKQWYEYFDQETLNLTYEMYRQDFLVFGYSPALSQRLDLQSPIPEVPPKNVQTFRRNSAVVAGRRVSRLLTLKTASTRALSTRSLRGSLISSPIAKGGSARAGLLEPLTERSSSSEYDSIATDTPV